MSKVRFLGLDVHANTISAAIAEPNGEIRSLGTIRNTPGEIRKLVKRMQPVSSLRATRPDRQAMCSTGSSPN
jgi:hypothetical protein